MVDRLAGEFVIGRVRREQKNPALIQGDVDVGTLFSAEQRRDARRRRLAGHLQGALACVRMRVNTGRDWASDSVCAFASCGVVRNAVLICSKKVTRFVVCVNF